MTMKRESFNIYRPRPERRVPIIVHMPHVSDHMPDEVADTFCVAQDEIDRMHASMLDSYVTDVFWKTIHYGATLFVNGVSRLVYDPERYELDELEPMSTHGLGMVYTKTLEGRPLRRPDPSGAIRAAVVERFHKPYVAAMEALIEEYLEEFGQVWIIDAHSYPDEPLPFLPPDSPRPAVNLGLNGTDPGVTPARAWFTYNREWVQPFQTEGSDRAIGYNEPFSCSYVPPKYVEDPRVHSMMIELNRGAVRSPRVRGNAGGQTLPHIVTRFFGWLSNHVARKTGAVRTPINKIFVQGMVLNELINLPLHTDARPGDLVDGRRCRIECYDAIDIDLDIEHLEDCWVCRVDMPDLSRVCGDCPHPFHLFVDKWTGDIRWMGQIAVELLDEPVERLPVWEREPEDVPQSSVFLSRRLCKELCQGMGALNDQQEV